VHRITKSFIKSGIYDDPPPDNFDKVVTSDEHQAFARQAVEKSTILLKNERATLPLRKEGSMTILVMGNASAYPIVAGTGSGAVHYKTLVPPLWALADELGISRSLLPLDTKVAHVCNEDETNCISYIGTIKTNGHIPSEEELDQQTLINIRSLRAISYDYTLIFAGVESGEGWDRPNL